MAHLGGGRFAVGTYEGTVAVFDADGQREPESGASDLGWVGAMAHLGGGRFAVGTSRGTVAVFDAGGRREPESGASDLGIVRAMAHLGGGRFAVGTYEGTVAVFDADGQREPADARLPSRNVVGVLLLDARIVAVAGGSLSTVETAPDREPLHECVALNEMSVCDLGDGRIAIATNDGQVLVYELAL
jgi:WD40 repeat protein